MKIETKRNIGDKVWFKHEGMIVEFSIIQILINIESIEIGIKVEERYLLKNYERLISAKNEEVFDTKDELIKSLE